MLLYIVCKLHTLCDRTIVTICTVFRWYAMVVYWMSSQLYWPAIQLKSTMAIARKTKKLRIRHEKNPRKKKLNEKDYKINIAAQTRA